MPERGSEGEPEAAQPLLRPAASALGRLYERVYGFLAGERPSLRPWHFQWLATLDIRRDLADILPRCRGRLLDVGCGAKPYRPLASAVADYIGADVLPGPGVDIVLTPGATWPLADQSMDVVLCTQVLEHVRDLPQVWAEIRRVLRIGGVLVVSVPFTYNEHGSPHDYRRFSIHGLREQARDGFIVRELRLQGGVGSTVVQLVLNWWDLTLNLTRATRLLKAPLLPVWLLLAGFLNIAGWCVDRLDRTRCFYHNVLLVAERVCD